MILQINFPQSHRAVTHFSHLLSSSLPLSVISMQGLKNPENCESNKEQLFLPDRPCATFINQAQPDGHVLGCIILNTKPY